MKVLKTDKWNDVKDKLNDGVVFLEFVTDWCGDCRMMKPVVDKVYEKYADDPRVKFYKVNVEEAGLYKVDGQRFRVDRIPTHILLKNGEVLNKHIEYAPGSLFESWIEKAV